MVWGRGKGGVGSLAGAVVIWGLLIGLHPSPVWSAVWNFETVDEISAPVGCSPDIRLTGLDFDLSIPSQPIVGWAENADCTLASALTLVPHWGIQTGGVWQLNVLLDPNSTPSDLRGVPELVVSALGVPFYVYAGNGTLPADTGNVFIWRADLGADADGPGTYTALPVDLIAGSGLCETYPFVAADFTSTGVLNWVRGAACGPVKFNGGITITSSASTVDLDYAAGPAGQGHVVYNVGGASGVFYSNTVSAPVQVLSAPISGGLGLAVGSDNTPHLIVAGYDDLATTTVTEDSLVYLTSTDGGTTWVKIVIDSAGGARNPSIALDGAGHPCVAWWSPVSSGQVRFACEVAGWISEQVQVEAPSSSQFSLPTQTRLAFDRTVPSPKPRILAYRASSNTANPSGLELLLLNTTDNPPTITQPLDQVNNEGDTVFLHVTARDPDVGDVLEYRAVGLPSGLTIGLITGNISGTLPFDANGYYMVTVFVSDGTLSDSKTFEWTVNNVNRAPDVTTPTNQTSNEGVTASLQIIATDIDLDSLTYTATGLPPGFALNASNGLISGTPPFTAAGVYATIVVTVTDNGTPLPLSDSATFNWTILNVNGPPVVTFPGDQITPENKLLSPPLQIVATDPDPNTTLTYGATGLPPGLSINSATGAITGTTTFDANANNIPYSVTVTVSDGLLSTFQTFKWTVPNTNRAPIVANPGTQTKIEGQTVSLSVGASLGSNDPDGDALTFGALDLPPGLSINPTTGLITGTLPFDTVPSYAVTVSASDGFLSSNQSFVWNITNTNGPPVVVNPGPQTAVENSAFSLSIIATDPDLADTLTYSATGLPTSGSLSINATTGVLEGTPAFTDAGPYTVTVKAKDGLAAETSAIFVLTISNVNQPPTWSTIPPQSSNEGETDSFSVLGLASDLDLDGLTFSAVNLPPGFSLNAATGNISGTAPFTAQGDYPVTVSVTDGLSAPVNAQFTWTIVNVNAPPVITQPSDQSTALNTSVSLQIVATDPDPGTTLTYSAGSSLPDGLVINASGQVTGTPTVAKTFVVTITVSDGALSDTASFEWEIGTTNQVPVLTNIPSSGRTDNEGSGVTPLDIDATGDGDALTFGATGLPPGLSIDSTTGLITGTVPFTAAGVYLVSITVSDPQLTATQTFTWTILNTNRAPVTTRPITQTTAENTAVSLQVVAADPDTLEPNTADPNAVDTLTYSAANLPLGLTINAVTGVISGIVSFDATAGPSQTYAVTVTATDSSGLSSGQAFDWMITQTNRPPVITNLCGLIPAAGSTEGTSIGTLTVLATDPDNDTLTYTAVNLPPDLVIGASNGQITGTPSFTSAGSYEVTFTVLDGTVSVSATCSWVVRNKNRTPTLAAVDPSNRTNAEGQSVFLQLAGADLDIGNILTYSATGLTPLGLTINSATGQITGTILYTASLPVGVPPVYSITVTVKDVSLAFATQSFTLTVSNTNRPPSLVDQTANGVVAVKENETFSAFPFGATDPDVAISDGDAMTFSITGNPVWVTIDPGTGQITGQPPFSAAGDYEVTICVTDLGGLKNCAPFTLKVENNNRSPDIQDVVNGVPVSGVTLPIGNPTNLEDDSILFLFQASDPDTGDRGDTLTYSATGLPPGISINPSNGRVTGVLALNSAGTYGVVLTVCDNNNLCNSRNFTWTVSLNRPCESLRLCHVAVLRADGRRVPIRIRGLPTGATVRIDQVVQDEPVTPPSPDGGGAGTSRAWVLAERSSTGDGRVYSIRFTLTLRDGRKYPCTKTVSVPNSSGLAIDSGPLFNSNTGAPIP